MLALLDRSGFSINNIAASDKANQGLVPSCAMEGTFLWYWDQAALLWDHSIFFSISDSFQPGKDVVLNLFKPFFPNRNQHENNESQKDSIYFNSIISDDKK